MDATSVELLTLEPGQLFYVAVTAYDSSGNESVFSEELTGRLEQYRIFLPVVSRE